MTITSRTGGGIGAPTPIPSPPSPTPNPTLNATPNPTTITQATEHNIGHTDSIQFGSTPSGHVYGTDDYTSSFSGYSAPSGSYDNASSAYGASSGGYGASSTDYGASSSRYGASSSYYGASSSGYYGASSSDYGASSSGYGAFYSDNIESRPQYSDTIIANDMDRAKKIARTEGASSVHSSHVTAVANTLAAEFDQKITSLSPRTPELINQKISDALKNTTIEADEDLANISTSMGEVDKNHIALDLNNLQKAEVLHTLTEMVLGNDEKGNQTTSMEIQYSARRSDSRNLPQASDAYNAQIQTLAQEYPALMGEDGKPKLPDVISRVSISGKEAKQIINDIYNRYELDNKLKNGAPLTLNMNRGSEVSPEQIRETEDLLNILNNTVNGKSTMHFIRDFNTINDKKYSIDKVVIEMMELDKDHAGGNSPGEKSPTLYFSIIDLSNQN